MKLEEITHSAPVVLVEVYASWCPHCRKMQKVIEQARELTSDRVAVHRLDIDRNEEAALALRVESVPAYVLFADGTEVWRHTGEIDGDVLMAQLLLY